ncbi:MAG: SRPBCC domain-containing protein [Gammaproteobacteria bacterium]
MRKELYTEIGIAAGAEKVWRILLDFARYGEWNPLIRSVEGTAEVGAWLRVGIDMPDGRRLRIRPTVVTVRPRRELGWIARLGVPGFLDGEHIFHIEALSDTQVTFIHREIFTGVLVLFLWPLLKRRLQVGFEAMNSALRERAEAGNEQLAEH